MDASPARLISSRALFSVYGPINRASRHVKGRLSPSLLLLLYGCPSLQGKKSRKTKKSQSPKSIIIHAAGPVSGISPFSSLKMTTPLQSLAHQPQKEKIYYLFCAIQCFVSSICCK